MNSFRKWSRWLGFGLAITLFLAFISFVTVRSMAKAAGSDATSHSLTFMIQSVEKINFHETLQDYQQREGRNSDLWVLSKEGAVVDTSSRAKKVPFNFSQIDLPEAVHEAHFHYPWFSVNPDYGIVRLNSTPDRFLLIEYRHLHPLRGFFSVELALFFFLTAFTSLSAVGFTYFYLKRKSMEARTVLARLEKGDLAARFEIKRVGEIGSLMTDFNRMAAEIERLVQQVQKTESARKNLLEQLAHDMRTPLTSVRTSIETLSDHYDELPPQDRTEFFSMIRAELAYFVGLVEDLLFVANLDEPRYKKSTEQIDLASLIHDELKQRSTNPRLDHLNWQAHLNLNATKAATVSGDSVLIHRMIRNALENAAKYTKDEVKLNLIVEQSQIKLFIEDNGPGITPEAQAQFGTNLQNRSSAFDVDPQISLGLGSVIMKSIADLHGGTLEVGARTPEPGTRLTITLPQST